MECDRMAIHSLFSKRGQALPKSFTYDKLPQKLRAQLVHLMKATLGQFEDMYGTKHPAYYDQVRKVVAEEHGRLTLSEQPKPALDVLSCIYLSEEVPLVLDIVETAINVLRRQPQRLDGMALHYKGRKLSDAIDDLNHRFRENGVGYEFNEGAGKLIRIDGLLTHRELIQPVLSLLTAPHFKTANAEFIAALQDYRQGQYGDALTKCCSAYESVLKVICDRNGWAYPDKATVGPLVKATIAGAGLDPCYEQILLSPGILRNRMSTAHGGGSVPRKTEEHQFKYALHLTAAAMQFLAEQSA